MSDWQVGDLALCVDGDPHPTATRLHPEYPVEGRTYRVVGIAPPRCYTNGDCCIGLVIEGLRSGNPDNCFHPYRFVKIRPDEPKEADELERCPLLLELIKRKVKA